MSDVTSMYEKMYAETYTRINVAKYASYCVGSALGDWSEEAVAVYDKVLADDSEFAGWLENIAENPAHFEQGFGPRRPDDERPTEEGGADNGK
jgi:hypothetical protein